MKRFAQLLTAMLCAFGLAACSPRDAGDTATRAEVQQARAEIERLQQQNAALATKLDAVAAQLRETQQTLSSSASKPLLNDQQPIALTNISNTWTVVGLVYYQGRLYYTEADGRDAKSFGKKWYDVTPGKGATDDDDAPSFK